VRKYETIAREPVILRLAAGRFRLHIAGNSTHSLSHDFGNKLARARSERGLTIEEAAHATRMRPAHIQALEDGNLSRFPNAAYAKSFLTMYARFLDVDVEDVAATIDTTPQMRVSDFQYLSNRASDESRLKKEAKDTRYDFVVPQQGPGSWKPLIAAAALIVAAGGIIVVLSNLNRIGDAGKSAASPKPEDVAAAVRPLDSAEPEPVSVPEPARPVVVAPPSAPAPTNAPEIPRAKPVSPAAALAANDSAALSDVVVVARPPAAPPPLVADPDAIILEPKLKTWIVIRNGPGGEPLFEDFLYPSARAMRLPAGRYFIELKDPSAVTIMKNGQRVAYSAPGVVVQ
jgi:cytoskeletal protein RodZ